MRRARTRRQRRLWTVAGIAAVVVITVWAFNVYDGRTAEAADRESVETGETAPVVTYAAPATTSPQPDRTWPDTGPITDVLTLLTAKTPDMLVGLPVHAQRFTVQRIANANSFTVGPSMHQQVLITLPYRETAAAGIRRGQVVSIRGEVRRSRQENLHIAATGVEIQR